MLSGRVELTDPPVGQGAKGVFERLAGLESFIGVSRGGRASSSRGGGVGGGAGASGNLIVRRGRFSCS